MTVNIRATLTNKYPAVESLGTATWNRKAAELRTDTRAGVELAATAAVSVATELVPRISARHLEDAYAVTADLAGSPRMGSVVEAVETLRSRLGGAASIEVYIDGDLQADIEDQLVNAGADQVVAAGSWASH